MITWKATIKEVGNEHLLTPTYSINNEEEKYLNEQFFIDFWGLDNDDVEWYKLERIDK